MDGVLVANELVDYSNREGKECLLFKVEFEKAYDKVSWNFLRYMMRRMGFGIRWMRWMESLVFTSNMSVLVNGSPTKEFGVERGLRQGDRISRFLFVVVAEGLKVLVGKAVENGDFMSCNVNGNFFIDILQFVDDTLLVGNGSWNHLWAIKAVLRGFELVSGLGINYHKSKLIGININPHFLEETTSFLSCRTEAKEFNFLSGSNPRRISSWRPLLENIKRRLNSWKGRWLSFGGRITLLKPILSSLAIFTLSFYKAPKKIIKEINKMQSNFLWGGFGGDQESLLGASNALWFRMLKARYADVKLCAAAGVKNFVKKSSRSVWWSDILALGKKLPEEFFAKSCKFRVGLGYSISFWHARWLDEGIIKDIFSDLFALSLLQDASIGGMGGWIDDVWHWGDLDILNPTVTGSTTDVNRLMLLLPAPVHSPGSTDTTSWLHTGDGIFSVSSCYKVL
ncbi:uncharacterized protein LOC131649574 [Vicia villosa]|uniref:uncharacterized protein LOC131649574 n=1 Tax=Vicia villosa TaxID=3911 RepID=UPI00273A7D6A|nr:uncharacterized protein LOC131649574 [Vicia villosa]